MVLTTQAENNDDWMNSVSGSGVDADLFERAFALERLLSSEGQPTHLVDQKNGWCLEGSREPEGLRWHAYDTGSRDTLFQLSDLRPSENRIVMLEYTPKASLDRAERLQAFQEAGEMLQKFAALKE